MLDHHFSNFGRSPVPDDVQRLGPRAYLVLENKISKVFYHIWALQSMDHDHFSNLLFPCPRKDPHEI